MLFPLTSSFKKRVVDIKVHVRLYQQLPRRTVSIVNESVRLRKLSRVNTAARLIPDSKLWEFDKEKRSVTICEETVHVP